MLLAEQSSDEENQETSAVIQYVNAGMPEVYSGIGISSGSQLLQSGIGIRIQSVTAGNAKIGALKKGTLSAPAGILLHGC
jgi:hypothetical protein